MDSRVITQLIIYIMIGLACAKQLSCDLENAKIKFKNSSILSDYDKYLVSIDQIRQGCSSSIGLLFMLGVYVLTVVLCPVWFIIKLRNI